MKKINEQQINTNVISSIFELEIHAGMCETT